MDKGITFTHLISACTLLAIIGAFLFGYIILKVQTMISKLEKSISKEMDEKIEKIDIENDNKHKTIMLKLDEIFKSINKIIIDIVKIEGKSINQENPDSGN